MRMILFQRKKIQSLLYFDNSFSLLQLFPGEKLMTESIRKCKPSPPLSPGANDTLDILPFSSTFSIITRRTRAGI